MDKLGQGVNPVYAVSMAKLTYCNYNKFLTIRNLSNQAVLYYCYGQVRYNAILL